MRLYEVIVLNKGEIIIMKILSYFKFWFPTVTAATIICAFVYIAVQQDLRQSANDPQIQIAEDTADILSSGALPQSAVPASKTDIASSLATYVVIADSQGQAITSSALLNGKTPMPPLGVLESALHRGENRVTWQPEPGVRSAIVVKPYSSLAANGYVIVGRSLREVEKREAQLTAIAFLFWAAIMVIISIASYVWTRVIKSS
jgi:hypothetical protein